MDTQWPFVLQKGYQNVTCTSGYKQRGHDTVLVYDLQGYECFSLVAIVYSIYRSTFNLHKFS